MGKAAVIGNVSTLDTTLSTPTVDDPTANLWACLDPSADRLLAAHALTGVDQAALAQLGAAAAITQPEIRRRLERGPHTTEFVLMVAAAEPMLGAVPRWAYDNEMLRDARHGVGHALTLLASAHSEGLSEATSSAMADHHHPSLASVLTLIDQRTRQQHHILLQLVAMAVQAGLCRTEADGVPRLVPTEQGELVCSSIPQLRYVHPGGRGTASGQAGIRLGHILLDVPTYPHQRRSDAWQSLRERSATSRSIVVFDSADLVTHRDELIAEMRQSASSS